MRLQFWQTPSFPYSKSSHTTLKLCAYWLRANTPSFILDVTDLIHGGCNGCPVDILKSTFLLPIWDSVGSILSPRSAISWKSVHGFPQMLNTLLTVPWNRPRFLLHVLEIFHKYSLIWSYTAHNVSLKKLQTRHPFPLKPNNLHGWYSVIKQTTGIIGCCANAEFQNWLAQRSTLVHSCPQLCKVDDIAHRTGNPRQIYTRMCTLAHGYKIFDELRQQRN
jgi:hypothetical protein